ncbi:MAG: hypothetical protein ACMVY4_14375 [Minwuia sp.]|uniref:hypothetical protein n=1 Tax=Minwuia sp. TaxID=2493630 RepID=UPI003A8355A7
MRIEGPSYLPVRSAGPVIDLAPVHESTPQRDHRERQVAATRRHGAIADGFADALMNVSVQSQPISQIAMLYEVQRLAQSAAGSASLAARSTDAVVAYRDSIARYQNGRSSHALASMRA